MDVKTPKLKKVVKTGFIGLAQLYIGTYSSVSDSDAPKRLLGRKCTRRDDKEDVEDGRSDDGADADVVLGEKNADYRGE